MEQGKGKSINKKNIRPYKHPQTIYSDTDINLINILYIFTLRYTLLGAVLEPRIV
jgi:hypothetical protein